MGKKIGKTRLCVIGDRTGKGGRDRLSGILRYSASHRNLTLDVITLGLSDAERRFETMLRERAPDMIAVLSCNDRIAGCIEDARRRRRFRGPVMTMDLTPRFDDRLKPLLSVRLDNQAIAEASMRLLLTRGYRNFAYVGYTPENYVSTERCEAVRTIAEAEDASFATTSDAEDITALAEWLKALPRPCGVIAYYDMLARNVLDACQLARLNVPEQIAIVGSDDDPSICEATHPALSSVLPAFVTGAYDATNAFLRLALEERRGREPRRMSYGIVKTVERTSTMDLRGGGLLVAKATAFIRQNYSQGLRVKDVADHCRVSRRLLELRFNEVLSRGVQAEIGRQQLDEARRLVEETTLPVQEIGERCGFRSLSYFSTSFARAFGHSPRDWRKSAAQ